MKLLGTSSLIRLAARATAPNGPAPRIARFLMSERSSGMVSDKPSDRTLNRDVLAQSCFFKARLRHVYVSKQTKRAQPFFAGAPSNFFVLVKGIFSVPLQSYLSEAQKR